jgi:hypothetical protein
MPARESRKQVLFVSAMPAARSNAIGVQILQYATPFVEAWKHWYWDISMGQSGIANSMRLNSSIPNLWPWGTGRGFVTRVVERLELGWWHGDRLLARRKPDLQRMSERVGLACVAPLRNSEATRCREILETIRRPFVVHLWDISESPLNADYQWLFSRAERVFCLSESMMGLVRETAHCELGQLRFVRPQPKFRAAYQGRESIRIGLVGFLAAYREGMDLFAQAIDALEMQFTRVRLLHIGPPGQMQYVPERLKKITESAGMLSDGERDRYLADCNVAFLPGPFLAPEGDRRSKYSVPSRIADYLGIGLPIIAAVHPDSATSSFCLPLSGRGFFRVNNAEELAEIFGTLSNEKEWVGASAYCVSFFTRYCDARVGLREFSEFAERFL